MGYRRGNGPGGFRVPFKTSSSSGPTSNAPHEAIIISDEEDDGTTDSTQLKPIARTASTGSLSSVGPSHSTGRLTPEPVANYDDVGCKWASPTPLVRPFSFITVCSITRQI